jgi:hypothetical protein
VFALTPTSQYLAGIAGRLTFNGTGNDSLKFYDRNNPGSETYTFNSVPSTLSLATLPGFAVNWTGMGSVTLYTNGMSTVIDPSGTVIVDPSSPAPAPHGPSAPPISHHSSIPTDPDDRTQPGSPSINRALDVVLADYARDHWGAALASDLLAPHRDGWDVQPARHQF